MPKKPVNILFFSSFGDFWRGGQKSLFYLISNLSKEYFRAFVIMPNLDGGLADKLRKIGIKVYLLELPRIKTFRITSILKTIWIILKLINEHEIDIIHTDGPRNTIYAGIVAKVKHIPLVWHVRVSNKDRYDRLLYNLSSKIIIVADALKNRFNWIPNLNKAVTIHNGVDLSEFNRKKGSDKIRKKYGISGNAVVIAVTARIEVLKGQIYLIRACGGIKDKLENFHILLAGDVTDGSYLNNCKKLAVKWGINDHVTFTGPLNNIDQVLNETDIFVLPSLLEAFPRSLIEAMAAGIPVIATDVGGNAEAIENNVSGFIIPSKDSNALAHKIYLLSQKENLRLEMGRKARNRAEKLFGIHENAKKTECVYKELLNLKMV